MAHGTTARVLSFGGLSPQRAIICPNTAFPNGVARKGVRKGIFFPWFSLTSNHWEVYGCFPSPYVFLSLLTFTGEQENQTNQKPQIFGHCLRKQTRSVSKHLERWEAGVLHSGINAKCVQKRKIFWKAVNEEKLRGLGVALCRK